MDFTKSLRSLGDLCVSAVNPFLDAVHLRDAEETDIVQRKTPLRMASFLRAGGAVLAVAVVLSVFASSGSHSQSGRQKPANSNSNANENNTRPRQLARPGNSNSSTKEPANAPGASKSDAEQGKGEETLELPTSTEHL